MPEYTEEEQEVINQALDTAIVRHRSLPAFCMRAWPIIEPGTKLIWNWHMSLLCQELDLVTQGKTKKLVISVPPRTGKSVLTSVFWPARDWLDRPELQYMTLSTTPSLAAKHSRFMRRIITSPWYQGIKQAMENRGEGKEWGLSKDQNEKQNFANSAGGQRLCLSTGARVIGEGANVQIVDDPIDVKDILNGSSVQIGVRLELINNNIEKALPSRLNDQRTGARVIVMQRVHHDDPAGRAINRGWRHLVIPMEYEPEHPHKHPEDPRTEVGELLFPERFPREVVEGLKKEFGSREYASQYQQRPSPTAGALFHRDWFENEYDFDPQRPAKPYDQVAISVDATFGKSVDSDFVSMQVWGRYGPRFLLLDEVHARMTYPECRSALRRLRKKWAQTSLVLIENKANGQALIDELMAEMPGITPFDPAKYGGKAIRANAASVFWEAGNVWVPSPDYCPWIGDYVTEHIRFQDGAINDDRVDAGSQILLHWAAKAHATPLENMRKQFGFMKKRRN